VNAYRSQPYYLDVSNEHAGKGAMLDYKSRRVGVREPEIPTISAPPTNLPMLERAGVGIAEGKSSKKVKRAGHRWHRLPQRPRTRRGDRALHSRSLT